MEQQVIAIKGFAEFDFISSHKLRHRSLHKGENNSPGNSDRSYQKGGRLFKGYPLTAPGYADTVTISPERAGAASGAGGMADLLAERYQHIVDLDPIPRGEFLSQGGFCLLWGLC